MLCLDACAVEVAARRVAGVVRRTPTLVIDADGGSPTDLGTGGGIVAKLDLLQPTGSFKVRGAVSLLAGLEPGEVVAASGGNFGLAVAWASERLGHRATLFVPDSTPADKRRYLADFGATLQVIPGVYADALEAARDHQQASGAHWAHAYDQPEVAAGQGTAARELLIDHPELTTLLVACGGGGLLAGTVAAAAPHGCRVVAVETETTATLHTARAAGRPVDVEVSGIAVSSLGARRIGRLAWAVQRQLAASVLVNDDEVRLAQRRLWTAARLVAEPGGAVALAALLAGRYTPEADERIGVIVCGANTDPGSVVG